MFLSPYGQPSLLEILPQLKKNNIPLLQDHFHGVMNFLMEYVEKQYPSLWPTTSCTQKFILGVSGGCDSLALCCLMMHWCNFYNHSLYVLVMDHQLFPGSKEELLEVMSMLKNLDLRVFFSSWQDPGRKNSTGLLKKAREWRYGEAQKLAHDLQTPFFLTAHHEGENQEGYILREHQGASFYGQGGMSFVQKIQNLVVLRPLLLYQKKHLQGLLKAKEWFWLEDPGNKNLLSPRNHHRWRYYQKGDCALNIEEKKQFEKKSLHRHYCTQRALDALVVFETEYSEHSKGHEKSFRKKLWTVFLKRDFLNFSQEEGVTFLYYLCSLCHHKPPRYKNLMSIWQKIQHVLENHTKNEKKWTQEKLLQKSSIFLGSFGHGALFFEVHHGQKKFQTQDIQNISKIPDVEDMLDCFFQLKSLKNHEDRKRKIFPNKCDVTQ